MIICNGTPLTNNEANSIFGDPVWIDGDSSLSALFRAITLNHNLDSSLDEIARKSYIFKNYVDDTGDVRYLMNGTTYPMIIVEVMGHGFDSIDPQVEGWITYDDNSFCLNRYLSQFTKTKIYTNEEEQRVIALVDGDITHTWVQAFESMLWGVLPWYYPSKSDEVIEFFKSLSVGNKEITEDNAKQSLVKYVEEAGAKVNIREARLHTLLDGIGDVTRANQIAEQEEIIGATKHKIESYMRALEELYATLEESQILLNGLENQAPNIDNSVFSFFNSHKNVTVNGVYGDTIKYCVDDTLEFYDEDEAEQLFNNENSWIAREFTKPLLKCFKAIFLEKRGIIRVSAGFKLAHMKLASPLKDCWPVADSMPNPHIYFFGCSGANDQYYSKYATSGDWELGVEQSISATKNWCVGDSTVGNKMFHWLKENVDIPLIYVSDGSPIDKITKDMKLVTFRQFKEIVNEAKAREAKEREEINNG